MWRWRLAYAAGSTLGSLVTLPALDGVRRETLASPWAFVAQVVLFFAAMAWLAWPLRRRAERTFLVVPLGVALAWLAQVVIVLAPTLPWQRPENLLANLLLGALVLPVFTWPGLAFAGLAPLLASRAGRKRRQRVVIR